MANAPSELRYMTTNEVARAAGVTKQAVHAAIKRETLPAALWGDEYGSLGAYRVRWADAQEYIKAARARKAGR